MVNSKSLASSRGTPVWIAAYCLKQLKKAQVLDTDISSSVDKILHNEMDVVPYRVLAYLLLGVVRIYSKKVEYLFDDCNEVLIRINKFVINAKKDNRQVETLRMSVTIPDRFELDAFDLDILDDASGGHLASKEEITLKDVLCNTEGFGHISLDQFEEFDICENTCSADNIMVEDACPSHVMDMNYEIFQRDGPINLLEDKDIFQNSAISRKESMNFDTVAVVEGMEKEAVNLSSRDQQIDEDQTIQQIVPYEDEIHERSRIPPEESVDIRMIFGREKDPVSSVVACNESHQIDEDQIMAKEMSTSLSQMHQEIREVHEARNFQESTGRPQDDKSYETGCVDPGESSVGMENLEKPIEGSAEKHDNKGESDFQKVSLEEGKLSVIASESKSFAPTPQSKFQGGSDRRPKPGAITPEFMPISTPAVRERVPFSRKRKIVLDEMTVLPNVFLKKNIQDASDLVSNRRKFHPTLKAVQRKSRITSLPSGFYESLLPCSSLELQNLLSKSKMKIQDSLKIVETPGRLDVSESQNVGGPENIATAPQTTPSPENIATAPQTPPSPENINIATAPQTPPQCATVKVRSIEHPQSADIHTSDNLGSSSPHISIWVEQSFERGEELNLMEEFNVGTLNSHERLEREQSLAKDEDLHLLSEEINSCETENSESLAGWSERTRKVGRYLHRRFQQKEEEVVTFSQVFGGRGRKECARLFYEVLVLKTTSYVDVKQSNAYGDIEVLKLPKLHQSFATDSL